jgi:hypothetical protein
MVERGEKRNALWQNCTTESKRGMITLQADHEDKNT